MSVLKLATAWRFDAARQMAIAELETYGTEDPIMRLIIARQYDIPRWFVPAVQTLAQREKSLDAHDFKRLKHLGHPEAICSFLLKVAHVREAFKPTAKSELRGCESVRDAHRCTGHGNYLAYCSKGIYVTNEGRRGSYNFKQAIVQAFDCKEEDADPNDAVFAGTSKPLIRHLVPSPSSWCFQS
jgi:hypothetical protein